MVIERDAVLAASNGIAANWGLPVRGQRPVDRRSAWRSPRAARAAGSTVGACDHRHSPGLNFPGDESTGGAVVHDYSVTSSNRLL